MGTHIGTGHEALRLLAAFALTYLIGFERELRGSPAGNRTFALVGIAGGLCGLFAVGHNGPTAFSGVITGVGFIGAAVTGHIAANDGGIVRGLTTATTIVGAAVIGSACGAGDIPVAAVATGLVLLTLELRWLPVLRMVDATFWNARVRSETRNGGLTKGPYDGDPHDTCAVHPPGEALCTCGKDSPHPGH